MANKFKQQLAELRRTVIVDAAIEVIAKHGYQRTTIKQIAKQAGIADGTIYNYFKGKQAILMAIIERMAQPEVRDIHFAEAQQIDFETFVKGYTAERMVEVEKNYQAMKIVIPETISDDVLGKQVFEQIYAPGYAAAEQYLQHLIGQGELIEGDPTILARLFASPLIGLLMMRMMGDHHIEAHWETYAEEMAKMMLRAFQPQGDKDENDGHK